MKKFILIVIALVACFSANAQYYRYPYSVPQQNYPSAVATLPADGSINYDAAIEEIQSRIDVEKPICIVGGIVSVVGGIVYLAGINSMTDSAYNSDYSSAMNQLDNGLTTSTIGCCVMALGGVAFSIAGGLWSSDAKKLKGLKLAKSGVGVSIAF